jgi:tRNA-Thr(GGU) m(6)t(6)A37 methyltransferase TsaA
MFAMTAIGLVRGGRAVPEDDNWGESRCRLELDQAHFTPEALAGLADFSHADVVFVFDRVGADEITTAARHPRGRTDWPLVGIFAQRGKSRPNRIGVSTCRILAVHRHCVEVEGLDAIDGTPILDIKPVMKEFLPRGDVRQPVWATELMKDYW